MCRNVPECEVIIKKKKTPKRRVTVNCFSLVPAVGKKCIKKKNTYLNKFGS